MIAVVLPYEPGTEQHAALIETLTEFVSRATSLGYIGSLIFIAIAYRLFQSVETTFNDIWQRGRQAEPGLDQVFSFTMLVFWGPVVVGLGHLGTDLDGPPNWAPSQGLVLSLLQLALPLLGSHHGLLARATHLGPHRRGRSRAASSPPSACSCCAACSSGTSTCFPDINIIYGSATLAVLFLVSLFAFWMLVIIGVEVAYVAQNFNALTPRARGTAAARHRSRRSSRSSCSPSATGDSSRASRRRPSTTSRRRSASATPAPSEPPSGW